MKLDGDVIMRKAGRSPLTVVRRGLLGLLAGLFAAALGLIEANAPTPPSPIPGVDAAAIEDIVVGSRILAELGVLDAFGHVSMRHPTRPDHFLMSRSLAPALVTADDIMEFDSD